MVNLKNEFSYSYIILSGSDGNYYAQNGTTGKVDFSGSNCVTVLQSANDTCFSTGGGGILHMRAGTYDWTKTFYISNKITLQGEGIGATKIIGPATSTNITSALIVNKNVGTATLNSDITISDLEIDANQDSYGANIRRGIYFNANCSNIEIKNIKLYHVNGWGISFYGGTTSRVENCRVLNSEVSQCYWDCIEFVGFYDGTYNYPARNGLVQGCTLSKADGGVSPFGAYDIKIIGNYFYDIDGDGRGATNHIGIPIQGTTGYASYNLTIQGNIFEMVNPVSNFSCITNPMLGSYNITIIGNNFKLTNAATGWLLSLGGYNHTIIGNTFYRDEILGAGNIAIGFSGSTFSHNTLYGNLWSKAFIDASNVYYCVFEGNTFHNASYVTAPFYIGGRYNNIVNNVFAWTGSHAGIALVLEDSTSSNQGLYNKISENKFYNTTTGISIPANANYNIIADNEFYTVTTPISDSGTGTVIKRNIGYLTENKGTKILTSTSGSVAHGLVSVPTNVQLTTSGSSSNLYMGALGWYPSGSAGIWIVQTGSGTVAVNWSAEI